MLYNEMAIVAKKIAAKSFAKRKLLFPLFWMPRTMTQLLLKRKIYLFRVAIMHQMILKRFTKNSQKTHASNVR